MGYARTLFTPKQGLSCGSAGRAVNVADVAIAHVCLPRKLAPFSSTLGRPSIDPGLIIRMLIVGY